MVKNIIRIICSKCSKSHWREKMLQKVQGGSGRYKFKTWFQCQGKCWFSASHNETNYDKNKVRRRLYRHSSISHGMTQTKQKSNICKTFLYQRSSFAYYIWQRHNFNSSWSQKIIKDDKTTRGSKRASISWNLHKQNRTMKHLSSSFITWRTKW